jgi:hypothetical protein
MLGGPFFVLLLWCPQFVPLTAFSLRGAMSAPHDSFVVQAFGVVELTFLECCQNSQKNIKKCLLDNLTEGEEEEEAR